MTTVEPGGGFSSLTDKQAAVLDLLANGRTSKEIATVLDLSESAVNRRIELLRTRFGGITRLELARRYRDWTVTETSPKTGIAGGVESDRQSLPLAAMAVSDQKLIEDGHGSGLVFRDSLAISVDQSWNPATEPKVVPRVLDGEDAVLTRAAVIAIILVGILASLVLGLAAAGSLTETLGR